jgi:hypothetical protein
LAKNVSNFMWWTIVFDKNFNHFCHACAQCCICYNNNGSP